MLTRALVAALLFSASGSLEAQSEPEAAPTPSGLEGLSVSAGAAATLRANTPLHDYYKILLRDRVLSKRGTKVDLLDPSQQFAFPDQSQDISNDTPGFLFDLATGSGTGVGDFFQTLGTRSIRGPSLNLSPFRTTGNLVARLDGKEIGATVTVDTPSLHVPNLRGKPKQSIANWLVLGVGGQGKWQHGIPDAVNAGAAVATFRGFLGTAWGWRPSRSRSMPFTIETLLKKYPTFESMKKRREDLYTSDPTQLESIMDSIVVNISGLSAPPSGQAEYEGAVRRAFDAERKSYALAPTSAIWIESNGAYQFTGTTSLRFQRNVAVSYTLWWDTGSTSRSMLQFRYENGPPVGSTAAGIDRVLATIGLNF